MVGMSALGALLIVILGLVACGGGTGPVAISTESPPAVEAPGPPLGTSLIPDRSEGTDVDITIAEWMVFNRDIVVDILADLVGESLEVDAAAVASAMGALTPADITFTLASESVITGVLTKTLALGGRTFEIETTVTLHIEPDDFVEVSRWEMSEPVIR